ncbi:unnamed protein product [marine sediment metagenome]|uniref:Uncharacterized protein n=1 Tax=marine sediment metagenome TaxID=412755 RepID=X1H1S2_9ZZZZ
MEQLIINIIRLLAPYLREMAKKTDSPIDDMIVNIICSLVEQKK